MLVSLFIDILVFAVSSLPLHFAVRFMRGKTTFIKTILVNVVCGLIIGAIKTRFRLFGAFIAFFVMLFIYREFFRLRWFKAFLVWIMQAVFIAIFYVLVWLISSFLGVSLFVAGITL